MYEQHFGLKRPPFKITPDTSLFYAGGKRGDILDALLYAMRRGEGIVKVVGEVGSGKTMLCRMLQVKLPKSTEVIYIANPSVSAQDILFVAAHELGLTVDRNASKHEVMHLLQDYLLQRHQEGRQVILFVEEAQGMPIETLEEIRLLSNLETDQNKLLQMILFGQPELDVNLARQSIRQLRERITHNFVLPPLSCQEIHHYLNFRMRQVGYTGPELVSLSLARKVEHYSCGLLRRVNIIADKVLLAAFAESTHNLAMRHIAAAVNDSDFGAMPSQKSKLLWWTVSLLVVLALGIYSTHWMPVWTAQATPSGQQDDQIEALTIPITQGSDRKAAATAANTPESGQIVEEITSKTVDAGLSADDNRWLEKQLYESQEWLRQANHDHLSIQILTYRKAVVTALVHYLRNEWPLDLKQTYIYRLETTAGDRYQVFYSTFRSVRLGRNAITRLPASIKKNGPYLRPIHQLQKILL